jgi:AcrR family transcriptional regulator
VLGGLREPALGAMRGSFLRLGYRLPARARYHVNASYDYLALGTWMAAHGHGRPAHFPSREALFYAMASQCAGERVLYLEFGVAGGASMRVWSSLLLHPEAYLHGFDSFEGLPEDWILGRPAGSFDQGGRVPRIEDPRVQFHKGWFSETLPRFTWPERWERLVVTFDADLYGSTVEALSFVEPHDVPGTLMYFDEFNHHEHELRAFDEFLERTGLQVRAIGETRAMSRVAFEVVA